MDKDSQRRLFQKVKGLSQERFFNWLHQVGANGYAAAVKNFEEAVFIIMPPRYRKAVEDKMKTMRQYDRTQVKISFDGIEEVEHFTDEEKMIAVQTAVIALRDLKNHSDAFGEAYTEEDKKNIDTAIRFFDCF